ncbi:SEC14-like protein 2 [Orchesella cincta]|uniref:SEC14-like protein 2 n=1 Tax=Orchesella cincta TaxID=48709 RepID=A0A1D2MM81_ORCCI|nr:SEC14-like protein 2 [Orchesella cincta]
MTFPIIPDLEMATYFSSNVQRCTTASLAILVCVFMLQLVSIESHETDLEKELLLTYQEKVAFDKFKSQVHRNITHNLMKTDLFMLRWIRAKNLDVHRAVRDMYDFLDWRKTNRIDSINDEDWSDMIAEHPYRMDVVDLQGRPVGVGSIGGNWNVRRTVLQGKLPRLNRYAYKLVEEMFNRVYEINMKQPNVTQFSVIASLEGFNVFNQGCPLCLTTYVQLLTVYNRFYPNFAHAITAINTPASFSVILDLLRPMLNKGTSDALKVYGYNQKQWKEYLDKEVSENQLTEEFGGTRPEDE